MYKRQVRITTNYKKLNQISSLSQLHIPRVDQVLDSLGKGRVFSLFDLVCSFHKIIAHKDTVPLTACCTPTGLYEWLVMPQGNSASPGWFVIVINEVIKGLEQVTVYFDDVIIFDSDPTAYVNTMRTLFERLRKHNFKFSPSKARLGATDADFLGHSISPAGVRPNADKIYALIKKPMPRDLKQVRALLGGVGYYRKFLRDLSKRIHSVTSLLRKGIKFEFIQPWRLSCPKFSPSLPLHQFWSCPTGTTAPAPPTCTATRSSTVFVLRSNRSRRTSQ